MNRDKRCIRQAGHTLDQVDRPGLQSRVLTTKPGRGGRLVAADNGVERTIEAHEQHRELERLLAAFEAMLAVLQARDRGGVTADDAGQNRVGDTDPGGCGKGCFGNDDTVVDVTLRMGDRGGAHSWYHDLLVQFVNGFIALT